MGRWREYYDRVLAVQEGPFSGKIRVAYEPLEPVAVGDPLGRVQGWVRLVIWKSQTAPNEVRIVMWSGKKPNRNLEDEIPHVNVSTCVDDLLRANLQGAGADGKVSLYLTDYTEGREVFRTRPGDDPWEGPIVRPPTLVEPDEIHAKHLDGKKAARTQ